MSPAASARLTLSIGGVDFCLVSSDAKGTVQFLQSSDDKEEFVLDLTSFTGRLSIVPTYSTIPTNHAQDRSNEPAKVTPKNESGWGPKKRHHFESIMSNNNNISPALLSDLLHRDDEEEEEEWSDVIPHGTNSTPSKKIKTTALEEKEERETSLAVEDDDEDERMAPVHENSHTQETLLAQMDLSQTQPSDMSQVLHGQAVEPLSEESDRALQLNALPDREENTTSHVQKIMNDAVSRPNSPALESHKDPHSLPNPVKKAGQDANAQTGIVALAKPTDEKNKASRVVDKPKTKQVKKVVPKIKKDKISESSTAQQEQVTRREESGDAVARVSIETPQKLERVQPPSPSARWGHTVTPISSNRFLVYGGQTYHPTTRLPTTLNDLYVYDMDKQTWFKPFSGDGMHRQWHTATYLPDRQLLLAFGGESMHPKSGKVRTHSNVNVLDTELMVWYPPTVSGDIPAGRSGHAAAMVGQDMVLLGGCKGSKWLNTVSVLNTEKWIWRTLGKIQGSAPKPRSYHSATSVGDNRIVIFGGNNADESFATVHVLEKIQEDVWQWTHPMVTGYGPSARTGHSATLLSDGHTICIYGGWDPNDDEAKDDEALIFNDAFLLDTERWQWKKLSNDLPLAKRVGHETILLPTTDASLLEVQLMSFGGRIPHDQFTNQILKFTIPQC